MKPIHVWRNHIAIRPLDLVLRRDAEEPLSETLKGLRRLGFDANSASVEVHDGVDAA